MTALAGWENFYVIVGSSAGALIGLQPVVVTLIADLPIRGGQEAGEAFAMPTIAHFGAALLLSAILNAPWQGVSSAAVLWGLLGLSGLVYEIIVARRMQRQIVYTPEFKNWLFHVLLPFAAYATLAGSAHAALAHALTQERLADAVIDFVGAGVIEVFPLQVDSGPAGLARQPLRKVEQGRPTDIFA